ncbi:MAG: hypothetical protein ACRCWO_04380, partial [Bosea sp. (in: a-proteobacteria)]
ELFYDSTKPLIQDDETPSEVLAALRFLNSQIAERKAARSAFFAVWQARNGERSKNEDQVSDIFEEFIKRRPELGIKLHEAFVSALLAVSFNSLFFGFLLRRTMLFDIKNDKSKHAESVTRVFLKKSSSSDLCDGNLSPA